MPVLSAGDLIGLGAGRSDVEARVQVYESSAGRFVGSQEYSRELIHDKGFEPYQWQLEGRNRLLLLGVYQN